MTAYVVLVTPKNGAAKISSQGFNDAASAIDFILQRSFMPQEISDWCYEDSAGNVYTIHDVKIL